MLHPLLRNVHFDEGGAPGTVPAAPPAADAPTPPNPDDGLVALPNGERIPAAEVLRWRQTHESLDGLQAELADRESALNQKLQQATAAEKEIEAGRAVQKILETNPRVKRAFEQALMAGIQGDAASATADANLAATAQAADADPRIVQELLNQRQAIQQASTAAEEARTELARLKAERDHAAFEAQVDTEMRRVIAEHPERYEYARPDQVRAALLHPDYREQAGRPGTVARVLKASNDEEMRLFEERLAKRQQAQQARTAAGNPAPPGTGSTTQPAAPPALGSEARRAAMRATLKGLEQQQAG